MLKRLYKSALELADNPEAVDVVCYIDDDDSSYSGLKLHQLTKVFGPRVVLSKMWNRCFEEAKGDILHHCGDDIIFRTKGWDTKVREAFSADDDRIVFVYGSDGNGDSERNQFGTHGFIHRNWVNVVGYFVPPYFVSDYNDTFLNDLAKKLGRHRYIDILTEHMHYSLGKMPVDQNTKDRLARHEKERPDMLYNSVEFQAEIETKREALQEFINENRDSRTR